MGSAQTAARGRAAGRTRAAEQELAQYREQIAAEQSEREQARRSAIESAAQAVQDYEAKRDEHFDSWATALQPGAEWQLLAPARLQASNGATLTAGDDRSVRAAGSAEKGIYTVTFQTQLPGLTALRLEALPAADLPGGGPGLPPNGNFVVTELELFAAPSDAPDQLKPVPLTTPLTDFNQQGFDVSQSIDGNAGDQRGWAVSPAGGTVHWATYQFAAPLGHDKGTVLQVRIHQVHNAKDHRLARFRLAVTRASQPVGLSLPESLAAIARQDVAQRSDEQKQLVTDYWSKSNAQYRELRDALATAQRPLAVDPGVQKRTSTIDELKQPVADDPVLVQLRRDVAESTTQLAAQRLTALQDLAWALINSPEFLFNH